jgi:hypothetical protein
VSLTGGELAAAEDGGVEAGVSHQALQAREAAEVADLGQW